VRPVDQRGGDAGGRRADEVRLDEDDVAAGADRVAQTVPVERVRSRGYATVTGRSATAASASLSVRPTAKKTGATRSPRRTTTTPSPSTRATFSTSDAVVCG